jgi:hypothetical protein
MMNEEARLAENALSVALAFGVRGLDPAFTFGGSSAVGSLTVTRSVTLVYPVCDGNSTFGANSDERKSGVKPPHSKASRHSHVASPIYANG